MTGRVRPIYRIVALFALISAYIFIWPMNALCDDKATDKTPEALFYEGSSYYQAGNYKEALQSYENILKLGVESGDLLYNIGNAYFKLGNVGQAIRYYRKAFKYMPSDGDLNSNLSYAKKFVAGGFRPAIKKGRFAEFMLIPLRDMTSLRSGVVFASVYILFCMVSIVALINRRVGRRLRPLIIILSIIFLYLVIACSIRYFIYDRPQYGVVISREADCKYEPIEGSSTYYKLTEGNEVLVRRSRMGWLQIRADEGKTAWVKESDIGLV